MTMILAIAAILLSAAAIVALCVGDPKRQRTARHGARGHDGRLRRLLAGIACFPAVPLAVLGDSAAFLIWFGSVAVIGWLSAVALSAPQGSRR